MHRNRVREVWNATFPALLMLIVASCAGSSASAGSGRALVGVEWVAKEIGKRSVLDRVPSTMSIDAAGRVTGGGGCNSYSGPAIITGDSIRLGPLASTRMACAQPVDDQERRFFTALASANRYGFTPEGNLVLYDANGVAVVTFSRLTDRQ